MTIVQLRAGFREGAVAMREACRADIEERRNEHGPNTLLYRELDAAMRGIAGLALPESNAVMM